MKKSQEIIGLPVFSIIDGKKIGQVKDLVVNPEEGKVEFILVSNGSWYVGARVLPYKAVMGVGEHAVTTESDNQLTNISETNNANSLLERNVELKGNRVLTNKGNLIGIISEYSIDEETGEILSLEFKTAQDESETENIEASQILTYGADVLVVKEQIASSDTDTSNTNQENAEVITEDNKSEGATLFLEKQKNFLMGKQVTQDIKNADGEIIITKGATVTEDILKIAENNDKFVELSQCCN
ncbi:hypothetical protein SYNTR_0299 [Candidatus Syntrophocurvum alkaliphilum]|uniref:PRC-barrel domain-containing protein n=1 Tax=Candidatus Syntrophocurvum alkaliphilum TaxID=2293317 RepID=A0A6I6DDL1_9FIRM|nr:PRC-barrel domain-containing protein [Candidatus Syntrophocurvum alkaliphilum]QGT98892.1 hypothetical protein SYNTR_0299 [Candidatus Syntrophocurvum alkaliphilum]